MRLLLLLICLVLLLPLVATSESTDNDVKDEEPEGDGDDSEYDAEDEEEEEEQAEETPVPRNSTDRRRSSIKKGNRRRNGIGANRRTMWTPMRGPGFVQPRRPGRPVLLLPAPIPVPSPVYVNPTMSNAVRNGQILHQHQMQQRQQQQQQQQQLQLQQKIQQAQNFLANNLSAFMSPFAGASAMNHQPGFTISGVKSVVHSSPSPIPRPNKLNVLSVTPLPSAVPTISNHVSNVLSAYSARGNAGDIAAPPMAPPAPPPSSYYTSALADAIHCMRQSDKVSLTALLTAPPGYSAHPFFNGRPDIDALTSATCRIIPTATAHSYNLEIFDFPGCGVSSQTEGDGKEWLSVSIRFPLVNGLKTPDDEVITIKCKPQDRTASANHAVDFYGNLVSPAAVSSRSSVFLGHDHDLQCDLGLFRKAPGSQDFTHRVNAGSAIELGQELQLRAVVHPGDGWNFAKLSDVIIYRVPPDFDANSKVKLMEATRRNHVKTVQHGETPEATVEFAHLVLSDGCRNPSYKAIAPTHPESDRSNSLAILFNFKAFMFQTMAEGEAVRITAKVTACVEQADCTLHHCDEGLGTFGRRRRRSADNATTVSPLPENPTTKTEPENPTTKTENPTTRTESPSTLTFSTTTTLTSIPTTKPTSEDDADADAVPDNDTKLSNTTDFDRNLTVVVLTANRNEGPEAWLEREFLIRELEKQKSCPTYLMTSVGLAIVLAAVVVIFAVYVILQRRRTVQIARSKWVASSSDRGSLWASSGSGTLEPIGDPLPRHGNSSLVLTNPPPYLDESSKFHKHDANMAANLYSSFPGDGRGGTNHKKTMGMNNNMGVECCPKPDPSPSNSSTLKRADSMLRSFQTFLAASVLHTFRQQTGCGKSPSFPEPKVESHPQPDDCHCKSSKPTNETQRKVNNLSSTPITFTHNYEEIEPRTLGLNTFNPVRSMEGESAEPTDDDLLVSIV